MPDQTLRGSDLTHSQASTLGTLPIGPYPQSGGSCAFAFFPLRQPHSSSSLLISKFHALEQIFRPLQIIYPKGADAIRTSERISDGEVRGIRDRLGDLGVKHPDNRCRIFYTRHYGSGRQPSGRDSWRRKVRLRVSQNTFETDTWFACRLRR
jgi:hypothetical protein